MNKLTPDQCRKVVALRASDDPVTITNLSLRFNVSPRTIYYILAAYKKAELGCQADIKLHCQEQSV
jgi:transcriptional antiterminator